jgi:hypothetical protein
MKLKILDTKTKEVRECETDQDYAYWTHGGGTCDCARISVAFPERAEKHKCCTGASRYVIVASDKIPDDLDIFDAIIDMNGEYPVGLIYDSLAV